MFAHFAYCRSRIHWPPDFTAQTYSALVNTRCVLRRFIKIIYKNGFVFLRICQRALIKMPSWGNKNKLQINNSFKFFARGKIHLKLNFYMAISCIWKHFTSHRNQKTPIQLFVSKLLTYGRWTAWIDVRNTKNWR